MSFTVETILDTKEPTVIEFLGPPNAAVKHEISGTLRLYVQKAVQLKQLSVVFVGEAHVIYNTGMVSVRSDGVDLFRTEVQVISQTTLYAAGEHTLSFQLSLPGDLATMVCTKLKSSSLIWAYELVTTAVPLGLFIRRKVDRQPLTLRRVHVPPSDTASVRFGAKRPGEFECSMYAPKFVNSQETSIHLSVYLHPYEQDYKVKEIIVQAIQTEKISFDSKRMISAVRRIKHSLPSTLEIDPAAEDDLPLVKTDSAKAISATKVITNPDEKDYTTAWGRESAIEFDLELDYTDMLPSESIEWIKVSHGIRFTIAFVEQHVRPLVVMVPFQIGHVLEELWSVQQAPDGIRPPGYGSGDEHSTLLDSNTTRLARQQLHGEQYPERHPIVPDLVNDLPPMYDHEECPMPYSEKQEH